MHLLATVLAAMMYISGQIAYSGSANVVVASNFVAAATKIEEKFEAASQHQISVISGSTGKLYAQILKGAPYDVFLSADVQRPELLEQAGKTIQGSRFTYAIGQLAIWSRRKLAEEDGLIAVLTDESVRRISIPNPDLAPFGLAAVEVMRRLEIFERISNKLVYAENVGQSFAFTATGNADIGFVSMSNAIEQHAGITGYSRPVPSFLHQPIRQDVVALKRAEGNEAVMAFLEFLKGEDVRMIVSELGYFLAPQ